MAVKLTFIEPELGAVDKKIYQPASYIRKTFTISKALIKADCQVTALGVYELYVNGQKIGQELLRPGFTDYAFRLQYQSHDLLSVLQQGENTIGAIVGNGWYRGTLEANEKKAFYGDKVKFAARLCLTYADGSQETIGTDTSWYATQAGALRQNDTKVIETFDARRELTGWAMPDFIEDETWHEVNLSHYDGQLIPQEGAPLLEQEQFSAKVIQTPNGETVLDFGQNHAGHVAFSVNGRAGHQVSLIMGEVLDEHGNFTIKNLKPVDQRKMIDWQRLTYVLKDGQQRYKSHFLICGYRYVKLENWPEPVLAENFTSLAVYSDMAEVGEFECSNPLVNQLVSNVRWSQKSNFVEIPTDCPQRERAGWSGDINVFSETANYLMKSDLFLTKWLNDFVAVAGDDGNLPYVIPRIPMGNFPNASAGWSDAVSNVATVLYRFYGDKAVLDKVYQTVKNYVEFNRKRAKKKNLMHFYKLTPHYQYILDTGYHFGEWMEPGSSLLLDGLKGLVAPDAEVTTAWWYYTTHQLADMARILGKTEDMETYTALAEQIKSAYQKEFLSNGLVSSKRMCRYVRPLYMGLVEGELAHQVATQLNQLCIANDYKIGTGF